MVLGGLVADRLVGPWSLFGLGALEHLADLVRAVVGWDVVLCGMVGLLLVAWVVLGSVVVKLVLALDFEASLLDALVVDLASLVGLLVLAFGELVGLVILGAGLGSV